MIVRTRRPESGRIPLTITLVGDLLSTDLPAGCRGTLLASYDADDGAPDADDGAPVATVLPRRRLPGQRGPDGWTVDPQSRLRYGTHLSSEPPDPRTAQGGQPQGRRGGWHPRSVWPVRAKRAASTVEARRSGS
jgi:hypothetical protein